MLPSGRSTGLYRNLPVIDTPVAVPVILREPRSRATTLPVLVTVTLAEAGAAPTVTDPKSTDEGAAASVLIGVTPV